MSSLPPAPSLASRWQRIANATVSAFHTYANWLVSISWKRFIVLSLLLIIIAAIVESLPLLSWKTTETETVGRPRSARAPDTPETPRKPLIKIEKPRHAASGAESVAITIDERGVRITPRRQVQAASQASAPLDAASAPIDVPEVTVKLPPGADSEEVREAIADAKAAVAEAVAEARDAAREAAREAEREGVRVRTRRVKLADFLTDLALLWIVASAIVKATYKGRLQAEAKAAQATETAEAEQLKRQVIEARMAAMQAQVEPHFLFNTLASIDHLIETDPTRASTMQKNLIALLRSSMPTMREANSSGVRGLGRELAVIRPYLEILKVRMEDRLQTEIDVPEGLHSAEFPPMMVQSLVENAIKHGLEPKAEGGKLTVRAQIVHGKLAVTVADTGLGFGKAATAGTGVGLANIRERLQLLYGPKASLTVAENAPSGTVATITVPYRARTEEGDDPR